jgi:hypothetical protein
MTHAKGIPTCDRHSESGSSELRFTVRSPVQRLEGSPRCHRPPGGDVSGRVHVRMAGEPADHTLERRLALAVFQCDMAAGRTLQRRVGGVDLLHPILASVRPARCEARNRLFDSSMSPRPPLAAREPAVQAMQSLLFAGCQVGHGQQVPGRQGGRDHNPTVDADDLAVACSQPLELRPCFAGISKIALSFVAERKGFQRMEAQ